MPELRLAKTRAGYDGYRYQPPQLHTTLRAATQEDADRSRRECADGTAPVLLIGREWNVIEGEAFETGRDFGDEEHLQSPVQVLDTKSPR